jgi:hypothetical protein
VRCSECGGLEDHHFINCSVLLKIGETAGEDDVIPYADADEVTRTKGEAVVRHMEKKARGLHSADLPEGMMRVGDQMYHDLGHRDRGAQAIAGNDMVWLVARTCHEVNRAFCSEILRHRGPSWEDASEETRLSAYEGVRRFLDNPSITGQSMHQSWMDRKVELGWQYGPVKDEERKEHPCCLPWAQLDTRDRAKDELFLSVCRGFLGRR